MVEYLVGMALVVLAGTAAWLDARSGRVPNRLTVPALVAALVLAAVRGGPILGGALLAAVVVLALTVPLFALRLLGGGDVKLMVASAALLGMERLPLFLLLTAVSGAGLGVLVSLRRGVLWPALLNCRDLILAWASLGRAGEARTLESAGAVRMPYGVAIATGALGAWLL